MNYNKNNDRLFNLSRIIGEIKLHCSSKQQANYTRSHNFKSAGNGSSMFGAGTRGYSRVAEGRLDCSLVVEDNPEGGTAVAGGSQDMTGAVVEVVGHSSDKSAAVHNSCTGCSQLASAWQLASRGKVDCWAVLPEPDSLDAAAEVAVHTAVADLPITNTSSSSYII